MQFIVQHPDFSSGDGWTLAFTINGPVKATGTVVTSGTSSIITLTAANSATLTRGTYAWQLTATLAAARYTAAEGRVTVLANVAAAATLQSQDELELSYITAEIAARLQSDHTEYTIGDRQLKRESLVELQEMRDILRARINRRRRGGALKTVAGAFVTPGAS